jgi:steroid delta-isomerase-like uncharacterized protein
MDTQTLISTFYEGVLNQRRFELVDELAVEDYAEHDPLPGQGNGRADLKRRVESLCAAFAPDVYTVEDVISEGDRVVVRWTSRGTHTGEFMGMPPTGRDFQISGIDIYRLREGRLAEHWHVVDQLSLMMQLGLLPQPSEA